MHGYGGKSFNEVTLVVSNVAEKFSKLRIKKYVY